ncbi:MAG: EAL domain-containing protein [Betaproteobacteria bacterium]|nr:EAL domain-containing protein [Betaproteobacteria bacterium]MCL2885845.1 EAL domain-containing protein [Betaproteobacteria bacterium]
MNAALDIQRNVMVRRLRRALGFVALLGLLLWIFANTERVSMQPYSAYLQSLRQVRQADVELDAAVLASYSDLLHNYDPLIRHMADIHAEEAGLRAIPESMSNATRSRQRLLLERLFARQREKTEEIDRFMRSASVLRNSQIYFPRVAEAVLRRANHQLQSELEPFVRHVMGLSAAGTLVVSNEKLLLELENLRRLQGHASGPESIEPLLAHAEQIIENRPLVDKWVENILSPSTSLLLEEVFQVYLGGYEEVLRNAGRYRLVLYLVTLLLVAYALYALIRFERDQRELARAHDDLSARYAAQLAAEHQLQLYATVFTSSSEGMLITDAEARIIAANPAASALSGYSGEEIIGQTPAMFRSGRHDNEFYRLMWQGLLGHGRWQGEVWNRHKDGGIFPGWLSISAIRDGEGVTTHYIGILTDISERKEAEARIQHMAQHDPLTGLPNRILLEDRVGQAILLSKRSGKPFALVFIDLDRFKNINDTLGHEIGDQLLVQAAQRGLSVLRDSDTLSRQGGDEFVAVLFELEQRQDASVVVRKLLAALNQPYLLAGHGLTVTGSAGIAVYPDDGQSFSELLRKADVAMYRAKERGRNTASFFSDEIDTVSLDQLLLENDLHGALERDELRLHYQPKVDPASGRLLGMEALLRWQRNATEMVSPAIVIPMAEANGLINPFGEWAIRTVCAQQRAWLDAGLAVVPVAVNISAQQFVHQNLPRIVAGMLAEYALPARLLELEMTESQLMRNVERAAEALEGLRQMNIKVAIDDFGTGYSSLSYLMQLPVQVLKIDRAFVREIDAGNEPARLASAIIAMAHELDLEVVAEGVETEKQRNYLCQHGCDQLQGYLFGRPVPADEAGKLLASGVAD